MTENFNTYLWKDPDQRWLKKVLDHIKGSDPVNNEIIILKCEDIKGFESTPSLSSYLFNLSVKFDLFDGERIMYLNVKDMLLAIEMCLKQERKIDDSTEMSITDIDILDYFNKYISYFKSDHAENEDNFTALKKFLKQSNCIDLWMLFDKCLDLKNDNDIKNHLSNHKYLILGTPASLITKYLIGIICGKELFNTTIETPLDISLHSSPSIITSEKISVAVETIILDDVTLNTQNDSSIDSATEEYIEEVILAFLSLLLNSKNELALCKAMVSPIVDLSHQAFTALKHLSIEKDMPMCQVAISYVTRIKLGGKGYAPPKDCPVLPHLKGLQCFVDILNHMQTITEEDSKPESAIKRLINLLKKKLLKCDSGKIKEGAVEVVTKNLISTLSTTTEKIETSIHKSTTQINQEVLDVLYHFINYVSCNNFIHDPELAVEKKNTKRTPLNLPPLLGYFRSPEEESSCDSKSSLNEDSIISTSSVVQTSFPSYFHASDSSGVTATLCINSSTPSRMSFKDCLNKREENASNKILINDENPTNKVPVKKRGKRSILGEITNDVANTKNENDKNSVKKPCKNAEVVPKKNNVSGKRATQKEPKKVGKKFKQIQGQGKITNFFIMGKN